MTINIPPTCGSFSHKLLLTGDPDPHYVTGAFVADAGVIVLQDIAVGLHNAFKALHAARGGQPYTAKSTALRFNPGGGAEFIEAEAVSDGAGLSTETSLLPQNSAFMVRKNTGFGGRRNKGRFFYPGVAEGAADNIGQLSSGVVTGWNTALATYLSSCNAVAGVDTLVLLHSGAPIGGTFYAATPITSMTIDGVISTQRRRLRK
jgi:hypothetical protein